MQNNVVVDLELCKISISMYKSMYKIITFIKNKLSSYSVLRKVLKKLWIKKNSTPPPNYLKRLANESNINTICLLYDIRKTFKIS